MEVFPHISHAPLVVEEHQFPRELTLSRERSAEIKHILPYKVGSSYPGKFVPAYARYFRKVVDKNKAHYLYFKPDHTAVYDENRPHNYTSMNSYADIYYNLAYYTTSLGLYKFTVSGVDHHIIIGHQLIMDTKGNILFLGVSKGYQHTLKPDDSKIYVASEFFNDETYKYVIKKLDSEFLENYRKEGVEIVIKPSLAIENEFFGPRVVVKHDSLDDFNAHKDALRREVIRSLLGNTQRVAYNQATMAGMDDRKYPSPIKYGYKVENLTANWVTEHNTPWNQGWDRKLLYVIMASEISYRYRFMSFDHFLDNVHSTWNPELWIEIDLRPSIRALIPEFISVKYSPSMHKFQLRANGSRLNMELKVTHRNEFNLMREEFGPVENVTFAIEEPSIPQEEEVSPEQDEVTQVRMNDGTVLNVRDGDTYTDSSGMTWTVRQPSTVSPSHHNFTFDDGRYMVGVDPVNDDRATALNLGIIGQIRERSRIMSFGNAVNEELIRQYPLTPDEAYLRAEEDEIVGQQERPEGDETGAQMPVVGTVYEDDEEEAYVDSEEFEDDVDFTEGESEWDPETDNSTELPRVPDWVGESNFTTNTD